jgi:hypothetical protein
MGQLRHHNKSPALITALQKRYLPLMRSAPQHRATLAQLGLTALALGITGGLGFALWLAQGPTMLHALEEAVAAWCF